MEKNVTNNYKAPSFLQTFFITMAVFMLLNLFFGNKKTELKTVKPTIVTKKDLPPRNVKQLKTENIFASINVNGVRIDDIKLLKYKESLDKNSDFISTLKYNDKDTIKSSYVEMGFIAGNENFEMPTYKTKWQLVENKDTSLKLSFKSKQNLQFIREISIDDKYMFTIKDTVKNNSGNRVELYPYSRIINTFDFIKNNKPMIHNGFVGFLNNKLYEYDYSKIKKSKIDDMNSKNGWFGFVDDYFMTVFIPQNKDANFTTRVFELANYKNISQYQADYISDSMTLDKGQSFSTSSLLYSGVKDQKIIDFYEKKYDISKFELAIDYGFFYFLTKPFTSILEILFSVTGNFGVAIILFTILIRLLLFPIAQKSYRNLKKMRDLQPEFKRIQAMYSHNKSQMNIEMAMLYKKKQINPLSGCLPLLLQIPIFFALYKSILISVDIRHSPFIWWIKDLSSADPTSIFNLFGLLPFTPYSWLPNISVLAIVLGITMHLQQKMQPTPAMDDTQQKVMKLLPIIMVLMFARFPSGLLLYWSVNNILSIIQQKLVR